MELSEEYKANMKKNGSYLSEKAGKYQIISPRFINGDIVKASPEEPAVITLPAGSKIDRDLTPIDDEAEPVALKPHHAGKTVHGVTGAQHFSAPLKERKP